MKKLKVLLESGIEDINRITKGKKWVEIYFHEDLDGVCTAIGMKKYLEEYGIKLKDCYTIQYGAAEFSAKKINTEPDVISALVDFSNKKIGFTIHIDHHTGHENTPKDSKTKTHFRISPSNAETISGVISPHDIFPPEDIKWINMIDSADFYNNNINADDLIISDPKFTNNTDENKKLMLLAVNRILLVYKNKNNLMTDTVKQADASIISLYQTIKRLSKNFSDINNINKNAKDYQKLLKNQNGISFNKENGLLVVNSLPHNSRIGSYDRYAVFKAYPDSLVKIQVFPTMIQISKNPFRQINMNVKNIVLSVLNKYKSSFQSIKIGIGKIKGISAHEATSDMIGFKYTDLLDTFEGKIEGLTPENEPRVKKLFNKVYSKLTDDDKDWLNNNFKVNIWDIIESETGGHDDIYNIGALSYITRDVENKLHLKQNLLNGLINAFSEELFKRKQKISEISKFKSLLNIKFI